MRIERKPILFKAMTEAYVLIMLMKNGVVSSVSNLNITIVAQLINHHPGIECDIIKLFTYIHELLSKEKVFSQHLINIRYCLTISFVQLRMLDDWKSEKRKGGRISTLVDSPPPIRSFQMCVSVGIGFN